MKVRSVLAATAVSAACALPAQAVVVYDSGVDIGSIEVIFQSHFATGTITGASFTLTQAAVIDGISFLGAWETGAPASEDLFIGIYPFEGVDDPSETPTMAVGGAATGVDTGADVGPYDILGYDISIAPLALAAGDYLLTVVGNTGDAGNPFLWPGGATEADADVYGLGAEWTHVGIGSTAFTLTGPNPVPLPPALALLGAGLAGLGWVGARRKT